MRLDDDIYESPAGSPGSGGAPVQSEDPPEDVGEVAKNSILGDEQFRRSITSGHC